MNFLTSIKALYTGTSALFLARQNRRDIEVLQAEIKRLQRTSKHALYLAYKAQPQRARDRRSEILAVKPSRN